MRSKHKLVKNIPSFTKDKKYWKLLFLVSQSTVHNIHSSSSKITLWWLSLFLCASVGWTSDVFFNMMTTYLCTHTYSSYIYANHLVTAHKCRDIPCHNKKQCSVYILLNELWQFIKSIKKCVMHQFHSCQPKTYIWGDSGHRLTKTEQLKTVKTKPSLKNLDLCWGKQVVGLESSINSMNPWT